MKVCAATIVVVTSAFALSACGGSNTTPSPAIANAMGTRSANSARHGGSTSNPYPFAQGDTFAYAYALTHSAMPAGKPLEKDYTNGTIATTIGGQASFDGKQLTDVNAVFTYTTSDNHHKSTGSGTHTTDTFETFAAAKNGGLDYETYGNSLAGSSSNSDGSSSTTTSTQTYGGPFVFDELPEAKSASWKDEIAYTLVSDTKTDKGGVTTDDQSSYTRNEDGSFTRSVTRSTPGSPTYTEQDTQNVGGSGQDVNNGTGPTGGTTTFSAPALVNGQYAISVVYMPASGPPTTTSVPDWFPGNGAAHHLVSDERKDLGPATVPAKCAATAGQAAEELRETVTALDVVAGTYNSEYVDDYVVAGEGTVCIDHQRLLNTYDNRVTGQLLVSEHFNETTSLTSESVGQLRARHLVVGFR